MKAKSFFARLGSKYAARNILAIVSMVASAWAVNKVAGHFAAAGVLSASATTDIFSRTIPAIRTNIATCGLVTVCDAEIPKPSELDSIFKDGSGNYRVMDALFMHQMEMNSCQVIQGSLYKYLMATKVDMSKRLVPEVMNPGMYRIRPYVLVQQKNPINNNYWKVANGQKCDANGTPNVSGAYYSVTVTSPTNIPLDVRWFNTKERMFIRGLTNGGTTTDTAWKIYTSALHSNPDVLFLVMSSENLNSYLTAAQLTFPVTGLMVRGTANVSDFESFCKRGPGLITNNLFPFWIETTRDSTCEDELYNEWREMIYNSNPLYANFFDLPTVEYNKQSGMDFQQRLTNQFFFGKALQYQSLETLESLEDIQTVALLGTSSARCVGKRASAIGIYEQHAQLNRIVDCQGAPLNLPALWQALYVMQRVRKDSGAAQTKIFEIAMPSQFHPAFNLAMLQYYKALSNGMLQLYQDVNKNATAAPLGFNYTDYPVQWPNCTLRVIMDDFFDDYLSANKDAGQENAGRILWIMDWSRIYLGIFGSERVVNKTGDLKTLAAVDPDYTCVMRIPTTTTALTSFTWTAVCECPQGNLILQNFSGEVPEAAQESGSYPATTSTSTSTSTTTTTTSA